MLDSNTELLCMKNPIIRDIKIKNIEYGINQAKKIINESKITKEELSFLKRKIASSLKDLEYLYLMKNKI